MQVFYYALDPTSLFDYYKKIYYSFLASIISPRLNYNYANIRRFRKGRATQANLPNQLFFTFRRIGDIQKDV